MAYTQRRGNMSRDRIPLVEDLVRAVSPNIGEGSENWDRAMRHASNNIGLGNLYLSQSDLDERFGHVADAIAFTSDADCASQLRRLYALLFRCIDGEGRDAAETYKNVVFALLHLHNVSPPSLTRASAVPRQLRLISSARRFADRVEAELDRRDGKDKGGGDVEDDSAAAAEAAAELMDHRRDALAEWEDALSNEEGYSSMSDVSSCYDSDGDGEGVVGSDTGTVAEEWRSLGASAGVVRGSDSISAKTRPATGAVTSVLLPTRQPGDVSVVGRVLSVRHPNVIVPSARGTKSGAARLDVGGAIAAAKQAEGAAEARMTNAWAPARAGDARDFAALAQRKATGLSVRVGAVAAEQAVVSAVVAALTGGAVDDRLVIAHRHSLQQHDGSLKGLGSNSGPGESKRQSSATTSTEPWRVRPGVQLSHLSATALQGVCGEMLSVAQQLATLNAQAIKVAGASGEAAGAASPRLCRSAFAAEVLSVLRDFEGAVESAVAAMRPPTLLQLQAALAKQSELTQLVIKVGKDGLVAPGAAPLLTMLFDRTCACERAGFAAGAAVCERLLRAATAPYLETMQRWLRYGEIDSAAKEDFMVALTTREGVARGGAVAPAGSSSPARTTAGGGMSGTGSTSDATSMLSTTVEDGGGADHGGGHGAGALERFWTRGCEAAMDRAPSFFAGLADIIVVTGKSAAVLRRMPTAAWEDDGPSGEEEERGDMEAEDLGGQGKGQMEREVVTSSDTREHVTGGDTGANERGKLVDADANGGEGYAKVSTATDETRGGSSEELESFSVRFQREVCFPIRREHDLKAPQLVRAVRDQGRLLSHLAAIFDVYLLGRPSVFPAGMRTMLASSDPLDHASVHEHLFRSLAQAHGRPVAESFTLALAPNGDVTVLHRPSWPLSLVLSEDHTARYNSLLDILSSVRRSRESLGDLPRTVGDETTSRQYRCLRSEVLCFVTIVEEYLMETAVGHTWREMLGLVAEASDVDALRQVYARCIGRMCDRCLLNPRSRVLHDALLNVLVDCQELATSRGLDVEGVLRVRTSFRQHIRVLFEVLTRAVRSMHAPHLEALLLRLDYNRFYRTVFLRRRR